MNTWLTCHTHLTCTQKPWYIQCSSFCPFAPIEVFKSLPVLTIYNFLCFLHLWCLCQGSRRVQKSPQPPIVQPYGQEKLGSGCCWSTAGWPCCPLPTAGWPCCPLPTAGWPCCPLPTAGSTCCWPTAPYPCCWPTAGWTCCGPTSGSTCSQTLSVSPEEAAWGIGISSLRATSKHNAIRSATKSAKRSDWICPVSMFTHGLWNYMRRVTIPLTWNMPPMVYQWNSWTSKLRAKKVLYNRSASIVENIWRCLMTDDATTWEEG